MKRTITVIPLAAALLALGACDIGDSEGDDQNGEESAQTDAVDDDADADADTDAEADADTDSDADVDAELASDTEDEPAGDAGTRSNPFALGDVVEGADWAVTINEVEFGADAQVAEANQFNDPAPEGHSFVLINVTATYTGAESEMPAMGTNFAWVTATGETLDSSDASAVAPERFDSLRELYEGGSETGNVVIAVPEDDEGLIRVRLGLFDREEAFVAPQ